MYGIYDVWPHVHYSPKFRRKYCQPAVSGCASVADFSMWRDPSSAGSWMRFVMGFHSLQPTGIYAATAATLGDAIAAVEVVV